MRLLLIVTLLASVVACSTKNSLGLPPTPESPTAIPNQLVMAGLALGDVTAPCTVASNYASAINGTTTGVTAGSGGSAAALASGTAAASAPPFTFNAQIVTSGRVAVGTYTNLSPGVTGTITITNAGRLTWLASAGSGTSVGTWTLKITQVTILTNTANGVAYEIKGTLDATVPAVIASGATGSVTVSANFMSN